MTTRPTPQQEERLQRDAEIVRRVEREFRNSRRVRIVVWLACVAAIAFLVGALP